MKSVDTLKKQSAGCRKCGRIRNSSKPVLGVPKWLINRCIGAKQRCTNPKTRCYKDYGGRGITFEFKTPSLMGLWIMTNIPDWNDRSLQIDRINNDEGYKPFNIRMVRPAINMNNQQLSYATRQVHAFMLKYPHVKYAKVTLVNKFHNRLTEDEILEQWKTPSYKPKGVYGISLTPDPDIASLAQIA